MKYKTLIGASLLTAGLCAGCDGYSEKTLSNAQIIAAKDECVKGGMDYTLLSISGNLFYPNKVVCIKPK